jgi:F-type H+-transporting ATPase subunit b
MVPVFLEAEGIGALGINLPGLVAQLINFGILLLLFSWLFRRFLFPMLDERKKRIEEGLQASDEAKSRLKETETEVAAEMSRARQEAQGIVTLAQQASSRIQEEARESARADSEQLIERARQEIQLERDAAISDLRSEFADLTITAAERVIRRSLDRKAHGEIIEEVLADAPTGDSAQTGAGGSSQN